jgi:hypothetical protein
MGVYGGDNPRTYAAGDNPHYSMALLLREARRVTG